MRLENENLETRFGIEDAEREAATLRTRVDELQALTEYRPPMCISTIPISFNRLDLTLDLFSQSASAGVSFLRRGLISFRAGGCRVWR